MSVRVLVFGPPWYEPNTVIVSTEFVAQGTMEPTAHICHSPFSHFVLELPIVFFSVIIVFSQ
jgi:hypothetical protein